MVNLNYDCIRIEELTTGWKQSIEIKVGKRHMMLDVRKDCCNAYIDVYKKLNRDRGSYSKYSPKAKMHYVILKNTAIITRSMIEDIEQIQRAQKILEKYKSDLA